MDKKTNEKSEAKEPKKDLWGMFRSGILLTVFSVGCMSSKLSQNSLVKILSSGGLCVGLILIILCIIGFVYSDKRGRVILKMFNIGETNG